MNVIKDQFKRGLKILDRYSPYPLFYNLRMSAREEALFTQTIKKSKYYLEFGSGGSTIKVLQKSRALIYSVESSLDWIKEMNLYTFVNSFSHKRLNFHYVNIGSTRKWGYPINRNCEHLFPNYSSDIFQYLDSHKIDTVLIDGRFRVACTLNTIINCYLNDDVTIIIHDFWNRNKYHVVLKYLTEINRADKLGIFKIRKSLDINQVKSDYEVYKFIAD